MLPHDRGCVGIRVGSHPIAVLSGPTFAREVAAGLPTAVTLACENESVGQRLIDMIGAERFRPYYSDDPIGAEIGGAVKMSWQSRAAL